MQNLNNWVQNPECRNMWSYNTGWFEINLERCKGETGQWWKLEAKEVGLPYELDFCSDDAEPTFAQERALITVKIHLERCYHSL